jgi:serine/threonine-protein phosphatase 6 regulatory ankyrin repeat subunit A/serine/threonine-protein phosphatase 6 regulatory ankyrin repeat subunit B
MKFNFKTLCACLALVTCFGSAVAGENSLSSHKYKEKQSTTYYKMTNLEFNQWTDAAVTGDIAVIKSFINKGMNVDETRPTKGSALWYTAGNCRADVMRLLIDKGANVDYCNDRSVLAAYVECLYFKRWDENVLDLLLTKGADPNNYDKSNMFSLTPLMTIAKCYFSDKDPSRALEIIRKLLDHGAKINLEDYYGKTALDYAEEEKNKDIVDFLENNGAKHGSRQEYGSIDSSDSDDEKDKQHNESEHQQSERNKDIVDFLKNNGVLYGSRQEYGSTDSSNSDDEKDKQYDEAEHQQSEKKKMTQEVYDKLMSAVRRGDIDTVRAYIKDNYDISVPFDDLTGRKTTVLEKASLSNAENSFEVMKLLLENGANPDRPGAYYRPLTNAIRGLSPDKVKLLWEYGADVNKVDDNGLLPLVLAVECMNQSSNEKEKEKYREIVKFLLMSAPKGLNSEVIDLIISGKNKIKGGNEWISKKSASIDFMRTNINGQNKNGDTALILAVNHGDVETVKLLLRHGANVDIKNKSDWTALSLARTRITTDRYGSPAKPESAKIAREIVKILEDAKAKREAQAKKVETQEKRESGE